MTFFFFVLQTLKLKMKENIRNETKKVKMLVYQQVPKPKSTKNKPLEITFATGVKRFLKTVKPHKHGQQFFFSR